MIPRGRLIRGFRPSILATIECYYQDCLMRHEVVDGMGWFADGR